VGPRLITPYGKQVVSDLLELAKDYDIVSISGLADGVDSVCHHQSIENNIPTIAVLG
jgi:DNA processing protein